MRISVAELIRARRTAGSTREKRNDPFHLALVIEGGGMRGVVAGGMVSALELRGCVDCFDTIHGSSAGACAGAYFLAGQARLGTRMFYEDINSKRFVDLRRIACWKPVMNTNFLIDEVMRRSKRLDLARILAEPEVLHIVTTNVETGRARIDNRFRDGDHLLSLLKATVTMPVIGGPPVVVDGMPLVDGGMVQQIPVDSALQAGATHVLVLMTRAEDELERADRPIRLFFEKLGIRVLYSAALASLYASRNAGINQMLAKLIRPEVNSVAIEALTRPPGSIPIDRLSIDVSQLERADREAQERVFRYLD